MPNPTVSILMNCFNGEKHLREAIDSVIAQTYKDWELVFFDNVSTDRSADIFKSYDDKRLKYVRAKIHTDLGGGRASAYEYLTGDYIAILDVDDIWMPQKLSLQIPLFKDGEVGMVICDTVFFTPERQKVLYGSKSPPEGWVTKELLTNYFVSLETLVIRRAIIDKLPIAFDPEFSFIADFDIVIRLSQICKLSYCPHVLAKWRVHDSSDTWRNVGAFAEEKERWINKQRKLNNPLIKLAGNAFEQFIRNVNCHRALFMALEGDRRQALKKIFRTGFRKPRDLAVLAIVLLPLSEHIVMWLIKKRQKLL